MKQQLIDMKLKPQQLEMERTLMLLQERDTGGIFSDPVKAEEVFYLTLLKFIWKLSSVAFLAEISFLWYSC